MKNEMIENPYCIGEYYVDEYRKRGNYHIATQTVLVNIREVESTENPNVRAVEYKFACPDCGRIIYKTRGV